MARVNKRKSESSGSTKKVSLATKKKKKVVSSQKKYVSLFSRSMSPSQLNNNFNQLNRIKNAMKEPSIMNELHAYRTKIFQESRMHLYQQVINVTTIRFNMLCQ